MCAASHYHWRHVLQLTVKAEVLLQHLNAVALFLLMVEKQHAAQSVKH
jgi:hypothetical protein